jgi:hypothetical protein
MDDQVFAMRDSVTSWFEGEVLANKTIVEFADWF